MTYSVICSTKDIAGMQIKERLKERGFEETQEERFSHKVLLRKGKDEVKLYTTDQESIHAEKIDQEMEGDRIIFATRHSSASGRKTLSVHVQGNWGKAELGGKDRTLCKAMPGVMKKALKRMTERSEGTDYDASMECTHHGPEMEKPCMFIEIGSDEESWNNKEAGNIIADTIIEIIDEEMGGKDKENEERGDEKPEGIKSIIVLGGGHYNRTANKLMLKTGYAVGHICPKHWLELLDRDIMRQAIEKNPGFEMVVLDWKGLGKEKQKVVELLDSMGVKYERYKRLKKRLEECNQKDEGEKEQQLKKQTK